MLVLAAALAGSLTACQKAQEPSCEGVRFSVGADCEITDVTKGKISDYTTLPAAGEFTITIKNASSELFWTGKLSAWDSTTPMSVGDYTVEAVYGSSDVEGFDKPYFTGSAKFTINGAATTDVKIPVKLNNAIVRVNCTEAFKKYFTGYSFNVTTGSGTVIPFVKDETRAAFIEAYKITVTAPTLINQYSQNVKFSTLTYSDLEEATCYTLVFDASQTGGVTVNISYNEDIAGTVEKEVELNY